MRALLVAALLVLPLAGRAAAEEPLHIKTPSTLKTDGGSEVRLPAGVYVIGAAEWAALDVEVRRLQEQETRLVAENAALRESAGEGPGLGTLGLVVGAFAAGVAAAALF